MKIFRKKLKNQRKHLILVLQEYLYMCNYVKLAGEATKTD